MKSFQNKLQLRKYNANVSQEEFLISHQTFKGAVGQTSGRMRCDASRKDESSDIEQNQPFGDHK